MIWSRIVSFIASTWKTPVRPEYPSEHRVQASGLRPRQNRQKVRTSRWATTPLRPPATKWGGTPMWRSLVMAPGASVA
jgi:hypothetical protein